VRRMFLYFLVFFILYVGARTDRTNTPPRPPRRGDRHTLELAMSRIAQVVILLIGALAAMTVVFPSFTPANLIGTLGLGSVAIGLAFKDIFENFLAGILILVTRPFDINDQIRCGEFEGTVEDIQTRATYLTTYDGRRVIIPNGELFTSAVTVNTAFPKRRWEYDFAIGRGDDVEAAREIILQTLRDLPSVEPDPKADVIVVALADHSVTLRARWWTSSRGSDGLLGRHAVLTRVKSALQDAGIDLPIPTRQSLLHDQTEETDGDRRRQRESWPAGNNEVAAPARIARQ
jgi:small conductance mechanosensitive channel